MSRIVWVLLLSNIQFIRCQSDEIKKVEIAKCCAENEVFELTSKSCQIVDEEYDYPIEANVDDYYVDVEESFVIGERHLADCGPNATRHFMSIPSNDIDLAGYLIYDMDNQHFLFDQTEGQEYTEFCLDRGYVVQRGQAKYYGSVAVVCKVPDDIYCQHNTCVQHCCPVAEYFDSKIGLCVPVKDTEHANSSWQPSIWHKDGSGINEMAEVQYRDIFQDVTCTSVLHFDGRKSSLKVFDDSSLLVDSTSHPFRQYCLSQVENAGSAEYWLEASVCAPEDPCGGKFRSWHCLVNLQLIPGLFVVSIVFLALLSAHIWSAQRHKLFGCMVLSTIGMLFAFYVALTVAKLAGPGLLKAHQVGCELVGLSIQFTYLSAVFWLNAMSFQIWTAFKKMRPASRHATVGTLALKTRTGFWHPRFKWYALYSWGLPLLVMAITLTVEHLPADLTKSIVTPSIGVTRCFLGPVQATLFYFHAITAPVLVANMVFFFLFLWNMLFGLWANNSRDPVVNERNRQKVKVVVKMFFVMGITWIAEFVSWLLNAIYGGYKIYKIFFIFDIINASQGFVMFCAIYFDVEKLKSIRVKVQNFRQRLTNKNHGDRKGRAGDEGLPMTSTQPTSMDTTSATN